jgi:hypothetical protein
MTPTIKKTKAKTTIFAILIELESAKYGIPGIINGEYMHHSVSTVKRFVTIPNTPITTVTIRFLNKFVMKIKRGTIENSNIIETKYIFK